MLKNLSVKQLSRFLGLYHRIFNIITVNQLDYILLFMIILKY